MSGFYRMTKILFISIRFLAAKCFVCFLRVETKSRGQYITSCYTIINQNSPDTLCAKNLKSIGARDGIFVIILKTKAHRVKARQLIPIEPRPAECTMKISFSKCPNCEKISIWCQFGWFDWWDQFHSNFFINECPLHVSSSFHQKCKSYGTFGISP